MFIKISTNLGNKHEMTTLVMLLICRHKTANLHLFKSYPTIIESICVSQALFGNPYGPV